VKTFTESVVEEATLAWLESLGYTILHGPDIAQGEPFAEREDYGQVVLERRLRQALQQLNPQAPPQALEEAFRRLTRPDSPSLVTNNHTLHRYLVEGVPVEVWQPDGSFRGDLIRVLDHDDPKNNDFLAVNQFTVVEDRRERRPNVRDRSPPTGRRGPAEAGRSRIAATPFGSAVRRPGPGPRASSNPGRSPPSARGRQRGGCG